MNAIELRDVSLTLAGRLVLSDISLEIAAGQFVGVLGPNGSGKTTLMRAILGLVPPSRGAIRVLGQAATRGNPSVGYLPQAASAVPQATRLSGWDFVASVASGHRLGLPILGRAARAEAERALDLVGARKLARRPLADISGGERQRLLLARRSSAAPNCFCSTSL